MSVLIKGMEMPKSCLECRLFNDPWCMAKNRNQWRTAYNRPPRGEKQNDCPLIEVPKDVQPVKHGRWIDGDYRCVTAVCSKCKHLRLGNGAKFATRIALYCEHCGARMDGA